LTIFVNMGNRLQQLYERLDLNKENGLFFLEDAHLWVHKFPYRISRILKDVIKPNAFFCIYGDSTDNNNFHPKPFNQSFILFFDNPDIDREELIHKQVINFGLSQAVFINRNETLDLYHGNDFLISDFKKLIKIKSSCSNSDFEDFSFINQLRGNIFKTLGENKNSVDKFLLKNITDARRILVAKEGLSLLPKAANRLIGRLLFVSYLIDRNVTFNDQNILTGQNKLERKESFKSLIINKESLYNFFKYLTKKYNGDMFPLVEFSDQEMLYNEEVLVEEKHLSVLSHLLNCSSFFAGGKAYNNYTVQQSLFDLYDFEIIPVELISSIYENFIGNGDENENLNLTKQKDIKAYYTPSYLVDYILSQTITPFLENHSKKDSNCKVLDPACGSGIFLVETVRKIIEKELEIRPERISDNRLWQLIKSNIYGIDIDSDAIDISIFSLYVTILDYKQPAEIETFKFQKLKDENFFGGSDADFFNTKHPFNSKISDLDFIIGNPPWGKVSESNYVEYISNRNRVENSRNEEKNRRPLEIGDKEICQAFLVRTSDFASESKSPICSFIVSSKVLYNSGNSSKRFRSYFLHKFHIKQVVELSPVNNKIRGGNHIFENARYPAAIITYVPEVNEGITSNNVIQHITVKPNIFFLHYKTIVIEKHDVKNIKQEYFIEESGGFDWLWKTLVYGNALDIHFIKRLKDKSQFKTADQYFKDLGYNRNGGLKITDDSQKNKKKFDTTPILDYDYLDADKDFRPFIASPGKKWKNEIENNKNKIEDGKIGYCPDLIYFEGEKLLLKKGVVLNPKNGEHYFGAVTAYNENKICFTATVASLIPTEKNENSKNFLNTLAALYNSTLFTYFILNTGPSLGIEKSRINFDEFSQFPIVLNNEIAKLAIKIAASIDQSGDKNIQINKELENVIYRIYGIDETEASLIDYALKVSIPTLLREKNSIILKPLNALKPNDKSYLDDYIQIFKKSLKSKFNRINKSLKAEVIISDDYIRIDFNLIPNSEECIESAFYKKNNVDLLGDLGIYNVCRNLYMQQDVRGFSPSSFYIIKPNERKLWHPAIAYLDVLEFNEEITKAEINQLKSINNNERS